MIAAPASIALVAITLLNVSTETIASSYSPNITSNPLFRRFHSYSSDMSTAPGLEE